MEWLSVDADAATSVSIVIGGDKHSECLDCILDLDLKPGTWLSFTVCQRVVIYCVSKGHHLLCIKGLLFTVYNWVVIYCVSEGCVLLCIKGFEENDTQSSFSLGSILNCNSKQKSCLKMK